MKELFVIRHCQASGQHPDAPLTENGARQAEALASFLAPLGIDGIVSSPYLRAVHTIQPLAHQMQLEVRTDQRLAERVLSGAPLSDWLDCLSRTFVELDLAYPGGESSNEAMARSVGAVRDVLSGQSQRTALVTHGNLMTLLLKSFDTRLGFEHWAALANPDVYRVTVDGDESSIERIWPG